MKSSNTSQNICFIDFETTGIDIFVDEPVEFGAILVDENGNTVKEFHSLIKLEKRQVNTDAVAVHGIDYSTLINSPSQREILTQFFEQFGSDFCFGAWNVSFDVPFFKKMCSKNHFDSSFNRIGYRHLDVQSISKFAAHLAIIDPNVKSLTDCITYFGLSRSTFHNALEDALLCHRVYRKLVDTFSIHEY